MTKHTRNFSFKVLTINTHKGFTAFNKRFILWGGNQFWTVTEWSGSSRKP